MGNKFSVPKMPSISMLSTQPSMQPPISSIKTISSMDQESESLPTELTPMPRSPLHQSLPPTSSVQPPPLPTRTPPTSSVQPPPIEQSTIKKEQTQPNSKEATTTLVDLTTPENIKEKMIAYMQNAYVFVKNCNCAFKLTNDNIEKLNVCKPDDLYDEKTKIWTKSQKQHNNFVELQIEIRKHYKTIVNNVKKLIVLIGIIETEEERRGDDILKKDKPLFKALVKLYKKYSSEIPTASGFCATSGLSANIGIQPNCDNVITPKTKLEFNNLYTDVSGMTEDEAFKVYEELMITKFEIIDDEESKAIGAADMSQMTSFMRKHFTKIIIAIVIVIVICVIVFVIIKYMPKKENITFDAINNTINNTMSNATNKLKSLINRSWRS